ncbi:MAG TPA: hypothetical protein PLO44_00030 [Candidatus Paceibacterota bacterium]|nr:hypothetical protein [Candidatus Paceibacterota bacterium]
MKKRLFILITSLIIVIIIVFFIGRFSVFKKYKNNLESTGINNFVSNFDNSQNETEKLQKGVEVLKTKISNESIINDNSDSQTEQSNTKIILSPNWVWTHCGWVDTNNRIFQTSPDKQQLGEETFTNMFNNCKYK